VLIRIENLANMATVLSTQYYIQRNTRGVLNW